MHLRKAEQQLIEALDRGAITRRESRRLGSALRDIDESGETAAAE